MPIVFGYIIAMLGGVIAFFLSRDKPKKTKYKIWGVALMIPISPALAFAIGITYAVAVGDGFVAFLMVYLFPILFVSGLVLLLVGIFKKEHEEIENS
ncbi:hypothetical protein FLK61_40680 [Paenalkalicoccus suaedae]|uniref:Major facilitator superfamily (MFS) profile domain-containing protein n=1 Tax=Paenalkalicoccus suaedae TaxID=2592382 RepID=A0A859FIZ7_9BACI|nr:hypothetical protein [Paenalkalicoccus suaedae]QKS72918.1 hypothetical protein FLK61_40680 [Paenalkalicoccus suaedae]